MDWESTNWICEPVFVFCLSVAPNQLRNPSTGSVSWFLWIVCWLLQTSSEIQQLILWAVIANFQSTVWLRATCIWRLFRYNNRSNADPALLLLTPTNKRQQLNAVSQFFCLFFWWFLLYQSLLTPALFDRNTVCSHQLSTTAPGRFSDAVDTCYLLSLKRLENPPTVSVRLFLSFVCLLHQISS